MTQLYKPPLHVSWSSTDDMKVSSSPQLVAPKCKYFKILAAMMDPWQIFQVAKQRCSIDNIAVPVSYLTLWNNYPLVALHVNTMHSEYWFFKVGMSYGRAFILGAWPDKTGSNFHISHRFDTVPRREWMKTHPRSSNLASFQTERCVYDLCFEHFHL